MLQMPFVSTSTSEPFDEQVIEAEVLERELVDKGVFRNLLRRGGRQLAMPAVEGARTPAGPSNPRPSAAHHACGIDLFSFAS